MALDLESLPFIEDHKLEINQKSGKRFNITFFDEKIKFHKNSLILIEVKISFPFFNKDKEKEEKNNINKEENITNEQETELELDTKALTKELIIALKKAEVFYQKYKENYSEMNKVQLLFFYHSVRKNGYEKVIQQTLNEFFKKMQIKNLFQWKNYKCNLYAYFHLILLFLSII